MSESVYRAAVLRRVGHSVGQQEIWCWSTGEGGGYGFGEPQIYSSPALLPYIPRLRLGIAGREVEWMPSQEAVLYRGGMLRSLVTLAGLGILVYKLAPLGSLHDNLFGADQGPGDYSLMCPATAGAPPQAGSSAGASSPFAAPARKKHPPLTWKQCIKAGGLQAGARFRVVWVGILTSRANRLGGPPTGPSANVFALPDSQTSKQLPTTQPRMLDQHDEMLHQRALDREDAAV
ncbi:hypothetical protein HaLaN_10600 [Haematococcus lacustris]|uniref:Uncharacterized protein n=1 Tax=Haematococcus lacustris TaxID=44745 RepID=A0A699Z5Z2_HAELA|nr:hypothetical protein HaLaN_10600 [Haematococcus lacustris]